MLQVIKEIVRNPEDRTQINFIYANQSVEDIILKNELDDIAAKNENFNVKPRSWHYKEAKTESYMLKNYRLGKDRWVEDNVLQLSCLPT